jgi:hypothetical protein
LLQAEAAPNGGSASVLPAGGAVPGGNVSRVSQIEHGKITEMDAVRGYVEALGGTVDVIAWVGDWTIKVA